MCPDLILTTRVNDQEYARLARTAALRGLTVKEYVARVVEGFLPELQRRFEEARQRRTSPE